MAQIRHKSKYSFRNRLPRQNKSRAVRPFLHATAYNDVICRYAYFLYQIHEILQETVQLFVFHHAVFVLYVGRNGAAVGESGPTVSRSASAFLPDQICWAKLPQGQNVYTDKLYTFSARSSAIIDAWRDKVITSLLLS